MVAQRLAAFAPLARAEEGGGSVVGVRVGGREGRGVKDMLKPELPAAKSSPWYVTFGLFAAAAALARRSSASLVAVFWRCFLLNF